MKLQEQDIKKSLDILAGAPKTEWIKIPQGPTPWRLLSTDVCIYYQHWVDGGTGRYPVVCGGGYEGAGMSTRECPLCEYVMSLYSNAKKLKSQSNSVQAQKIKDRANSLRAKPAALLKIVRGQMATEFLGGKKRRIAIFDSEAQAGIIALSKSQWTGLIGLVGTPSIARPEDLVKRVLWTRREETKQFPRVIWSAGAAPSGPLGEYPDVQAIDLDAFAKIDKSKIIEAVETLVAEDNFTTVQTPGTGQTQRAAPPAPQPAGSQANENGGKWIEIF